MVKNIFPDGRVMGSILVPGAMRLDTSEALNLLLPPGPGIVECPNRKTVDKGMDHEGVFF